VQLQELPVFRDGAFQIARLLLLHGILHQLLRGDLSLRDAEEAWGQEYSEKKRGLPHTGYLFGHQNKYIGTSEALELISVVLYVLLLS
jgi:hypothetical protein